MEFNNSNGSVPARSLSATARHFLIRQGRLLLMIPVWVVGLPVLWLGEKYNWKITKPVADLMKLNAPDDRPHRSERNLKFDFTTGDKYIYVISSAKSPGELIEAFVEVLSGRYITSDFVIEQSGEQALVGFPVGISFYDYHLMVRYFNNELGPRSSFGMFRSESLHYFVFQDDESPDSLVGFTAEQKLFSIYLRDDRQNPQLRLNHDLRFDTAWVAQWIGAASEKVFSPLRGAV